MVGRQVQPSGPPRRIVQWEIPLWQLAWGLGGVIVTVTGAMISFYMKSEKTFDLVQDLNRQIVTLTTEIKAGNTQGYAMASSLALLQFRMETVESDVRSLKNSPPVPVKRP